MFRCFFDVSQRAPFGSAQDAAKLLPDAKYDLVFIDSGAREWHWMAPGIIGWFLDYDDLTGKPL